MPIAAPALSDQRMLAPTCALYRPAAALSGRSAQEQWRATQVISLLQDAFSAKQAAWDSAYYRLLSEFRELESKLVKLSGLQANWNSYGADGPDAGAIGSYGQ